MAASRPGFQVPGNRAHVAPAGAIGVTVAKVSEAEVMAAGGINDILIARLSRPEQGRAARRTAN